MKIEVLGGGCARCKMLHERAKGAVAQAGLDVEVEYVTDIQEVLKYDCPATPVLVIDGEVKAAGRVPGIPEMIVWIRDAAK